MSDKKFAVIDGFKIIEQKPIRETPAMYIFMVDGIARKKKKTKCYNSKIHCVQEISKRMNDIVHELNSTPQEMYNFLKDYYENYPELHL